MPRFDAAVTLLSVTGRSLLRSAAIASLVILAGCSNAVLLSPAGDLALRQGDWVFIDSKTCGDGNKEPDWFRQSRGLHNCTGAGALYNLKTDPAQAKSIVDLSKPRTIGNA